MASSVSGSVSITSSPSGEGDGGGGIVSLVGFCRLSALVFRAGVGFSFLWFFGFLFGVGGWGPFLTFDPLVVPPTGEVCNWLVAGF